MMVSRPRLNETMPVFSFSVKTDPGTREGLSVHCVHLVLLCVFCEWFNIELVFNTVIGADFKIFFPFIYWRRYSGINGLRELAISLMLSSRTSG